MQHESQNGVQAGGKAGAQAARLASVQWLGRALCALAMVLGTAPAMAGFHKGMMAYLNEDFDTAFRELKPLADKGNVNAQYYIGTLFDNGRGTSKSAARALEWYLKSAEQGNTDAQYNLGIMYARGEGGTQDYQLAAFWYRKATELGDLDSQTNLATLYSEGKGVKKDLKQALILYRAAADRGHVLAQYNLAIMLELGEGIAADPAQAVRWYKRAAEAGDVDAMNRLGKIYKNGELGEVANQQTSGQWFSRATTAAKGAGNK